ncbi:MAG: 16S rRNA (adenine(1518)-N(6)/adenine(1519)-N(6))-dimethyltransferase RsmA [Minisyncoccia bacterium]
MKTHKAKKSLGQNFLKSEQALRAIILAGEISKNDIILEIGPGKGALTEKLLEKSNHIIAIEKDRNLFQFLQEKFSKEILEKKLILIEDDILKVNLNKIILERTLGRSDGDGQRKFSVENFRGESENDFFNYKIIANIPYNITGAILKKFLTEKNQPTMMVLMVQHEVAKRIIANDKKESILSISVKAYGNPKMIMKVPARYFSPAPKVDSAVIAIKNISRKIFEKRESHASMDGARHDSAESNEEKFWKIIHAGFAHKRKKLSGNLKNILKNDFENIKDKRAEDLSLSDWINLTKI